MIILQILLNFTAPENIGTTPQSVFWLLPLAAAGCIVYKTIKLPQVSTGKLIKEILTLLIFLLGLLLIIVFLLFSITAIFT